MLVAGRLLRSLVRLGGDGDRLEYAEEKVDVEERSRSMRM